MVRKNIGVVLVILAAGGWMYLDYQNKQQIREIEELRRAMEQARQQALAEARAGADASTKFQAQMLAELAACKAAADQTKNDFLMQNRQPVPRKAGEFAVPQAAMDEAARNLEAADTECQATYEQRIKGGF